jgi:cation:H+ antiporter
MTVVTIAQIVFGLIGLYFGADWLVRGGAALALRLGVTPLVVGLTVISFGTSAPELIVNVNAALAHDSAIALGNVIGSNIANLALVLGFAALIRPLRVQQQVIRREVPVMLLATFMLCAMLWNARISRLEGTVLALSLVLYLLISIRQGRTTGADTIAPLEDVNAVPRARAILLVVGGLALLLPGAHLFVLGAVTVAEFFQLSPLVIGLTVVAIGTSLPEIATSAVAAYKGEGDLAIGNAVGSNIFNIFCVLGLTSLIFAVSGEGVSWIDLGVMIGIALVSLPIMHTGFVISRTEGAFLLLGYGLYMVYLARTGTLS